MVWKDIPVDQLTNIPDFTGTWLLDLSSSIVPNVTAPKSVELGPYRFSLDSFVTKSDGSYQAQVTIGKIQYGSSGDWSRIPMQSQTGGSNVIQAVPVVAILAGLAVLLGLGIIYFSLTRVQQLVDSPAGALAVGGTGALMIVAAIAAILYLLKKH